MRKNDRPSIITREIEVENGVEEGSTIYHRRMVKSDVNLEGMRFLREMNWIERSRSDHVFECRTRSEEYR